MNQNKSKRHTNKRILILGIIALIIVTIYVLIPKRNDALPNIRTATVEKGNISVTVVGSGNLEYDDSLDIEMPSNIVVNDVLVEVGDNIQEGDILATIDPNSILTEIESIESQIIEIDKQINDELDPPETEKIYANVAGRVKKIYAEEGDSAAAVYNNNGALILLSLDGKMAVDFEGDDSLAIDEEVTVVLDDGSTKTGIVEKISGGKYTVTFTDNGPELDETVTVQNIDGETLGTGKAYIHQPISIIATYGTIEDIYISENQRVSSGNTLITLEDIPLSSDYKRLLDERVELITKLDILLELSKSNMLASNSNAVIMSVNVEDGKSVGNSDTSNNIDTSSTTPLSSSATASSESQITSSNSSLETFVSAFSVTPSENVLLSISVDELDILSIENGMNVEVTIDAISDKTFTGEIVDIANSATASGGVAKYTVKVLLPRDESMRMGMNATGTILVEEKEDNLLIPITALQESSGRVYVYTQANPETSALSGEVDVTTGISDGEFVEIISGLSEGDIVHYYITESETSVNGFGPGGMRPDNGSVGGDINPEGGSRPQN